MVMIAVMVMVVVMIVPVQRQCALSAAAKYGAVFGGRSDNVGLAFATDMTIEADPEN